MSGEYGFIDVEDIEEKKNAIKVKFDPKIPQTKYWSACEGLFEYDGGEFYSEWSWPYGSDVETFNEVCN